MTKNLVNQKELLTGFLYLAFGLSAVVIGRDYGFGSTTEMGAGFFPIILGYLLAAIGVLTLARSVMLGSNGEPSPLRTVYWKGILLVVGGTAIFAWLLPRVGIVVALPVMLLLSAMASSRFSLSLKSIALLLSFCVLCIAIFIEGLGVPMPIFGTVFG